MQIGNQSASQISNIETLNGDYIISGNTFNMTVEIEKTKEDIRKDINTISSEIIQNEKLPQEEKTKIIEAGNELKKEVDANPSVFLEKFKSYTSLLKEYTKTAGENVGTFKTLLNIGKGIGTLFTLVI